MIMRKIFILCSFLFVCITFSAAQSKTGKISGIVLDAAGKPLPSISVSLLKVKDSSLVKVAVSNKEGKYGSKTSPVTVILFQLLQLDMKRPIVQASP